MLTPIDVQLQIVHLVDDDEAFRKVACRMLEAAGFQTLSYSSAAAFLEGNDNTRRGCLILDVRMPGGLDGFELQKEMKLGSSSLPIIFLTGHGDIAMSVRAIKSGAHDFLTKPVTREILIATVNGAMAKESEIWTSKNKYKERLERLKGLTKCERKVFLRMMVGLRTKEICDDIGSATRTVNTHRDSVLRKMGVTTVAQLIHQVHQLRLSMGEHSFPTVGSLFDA